MHIVGEHKRREDSRHREQAVPALVNRLVLRSPHVEGRQEEQRWNERDGHVVGIPKMPRKRRAVQHKLVFEGLREKEHQEKRHYEREDDKHLATHEASPQEAPPKDEPHHVAHKGDGGVAYADGRDVYVPSNDGAEDHASQQGSVGPAPKTAPSVMAFPSRKPTGMGTSLIANYLQQAWQVTLNWVFLDENSCCK